MQQLEFLLEPGSMTTLAQFCQLHWLPIKHRKDFKILLITYKALNGLAPQYLSDYSPRIIVLNVFYDLKTLFIWLYLEYQNQLLAADPFTI